MAALPEDGLPTAVTVGLVLVALLGALLPVLVYFGHRQRNAVMHYATAQGWTYRDNDPELAVRYTGVPFVSDVAADAEAIIKGRYYGIPFAAYAYTYQTTGTVAEGTSGTITHTVPVVALLMESSLPDVDVALVSAPHRRAGAVVGAFDGDVVRVSDDFDETFTVRSLNPSFSARLLNPRLTHDLLAYPKHAWSWRGGDLLSLGSWNGKPEKITVYLDHLGMILRSVPDDVWHDFGGGERPAV